MKRLALCLALLSAACGEPASPSSADAQGATTDARVPIDAAQALDAQGSSPDAALPGPDASEAGLDTGAVGQDVGTAGRDATAACETDQALCARLGKDCGPLTATDDCGQARTVASCGACTAPKTCGGTGVPNVCAEGNCRTLVVAASGADFTTIQAALAAAAPCDTVLVRAGTYRENLTFPKSGSATGGYITLRGEPGAILDGTGKGPVGITIAGRRFVRVVGMTVQNFKGSGGTPIGISVSGASGQVELKQNLIHHIEQPSGDAHGIAVYGDTATPIEGVVVEGNEIRDCRLGSSESLVLNGNVSGFVVADNVVHDNDNIGIDFIGFEGVGPAGQDQARNGQCHGNRVYNISSAANPAYGGERAADGIYVDGGKDIVIERNRVDACDIGIEVASEHGGKTTSGIVVRSNFVSRSYQGNVMLGGYAANRGSARDISILNNTTWHGGDGEVVLQFNCAEVAIKNNVLVAKSGTDYVTAAGTNNTAISVESNLYSGASGSSPGDFSDAKARFSDPLLVAAPTDLHLKPTSPAANAGVDLGALSGTLDIDGSPRVQGTAIDLGAHEVK